MKWLPPTLLGLLLLTAWKLSQVETLLHTAQATLTDAQHTFNDVQQKLEPVDADLKDLKKADEFLLARVDRICERVHCEPRKRAEMDDQTRFTPGYRVEAPGWTRSGK